MLLNDLITTTVVGKTSKYYKSIGYDVKEGQHIQVNSWELPYKSKAIEKRKCDCCGKVYERQHNYNVVTYETWGEDVCPQCLKTEKYKQSKRNKIKQTNIEKYGVESPLQNKDIQNKQKQTMLDRYGKEYPGEIPEFIEKAKCTNLEKYGCENPSQNQEIQNKMRNTLYLNNKCPTSIQQIQIKDIIKELYPNDIVELNYPESRTSLDVLLQKIDIEYDGSYWHQDEQRDRRRDEYLKSKNYKILRIKSGHQIPEVNQIIDSINYLIQDNNSFTEIILSDWK